MTTEENEITFRLEDEDGLLLKTDDHDDLLICFDDEDASYVEINKEVEVDAMSDTLHGLHVLVGGRFYRVSEIVSKAESAMPDILREVAAEARAEEDMARELSSPKQTGRI